ncbi:MAG: hypothetical protein ACFFFT_00120 [Candidatus Thorarchaeota archaeon]
MIIIGKDKDKNNALKCGFCNTELEDRKELNTTKYGRKTIISCPHCNAILGVYYA